MPFVTEELWQTIGGAKRETLMLAAWPDHAALPIDAAAGAELDWAVRLISAIRAVRAEMNVPAAAKIELRLLGANHESRRRLEAHREAIERIARIGGVATAGGVPDGSIQVPLDEALIVLPLAGVIDFARERARLAQERDKLQAEIGKIDAKLNNPAFVAKAPEEVVEENRERRVELDETLGKLVQALERLRDA